MANDKLMNFLIIGTLIVVVLLILYSLFPKVSKPFLDEIDNIRKEVFGIGVSEMEEGEEEKAIKSFNELVNAFKETSKGKISCVSSLRVIPGFSKEYFIKIERIGVNTKFALYDKSNVMPKNEEIDNPVIIDGVFWPCVVSGPQSAVEGDSFILKYGSVPYIERRFNDWELDGNYPVFYKLNDLKVCFITHSVGKRNDEYFRKLFICGKETRHGGGATGEG